MAPAGKGMTMANTMTYGAGARVGEGSGWLARVRKGLADYRRYRATLDELGGLNDREPQDLGLSRGSIRDVARESVYG